MELTDFYLTFNASCQLLQVVHLIGGFFFLLFALVVTALCFLLDLVTWFQLKIYEFYIPFLAGAYAFFSRGLAYACS